MQKTVSMRIAAITINREGEATAAMLHRDVGAAMLKKPDDVSLADFVTRAWPKYDGFVFCMAVGIVVRVIAPNIVDKYRDPAVVAVDNGRRHAISLLSGHEGGANELAYLVARITGAEPVVTTATETQKQHVIGIGCRKDIEADRVVAAVLESLAMRELTPADIRLAASVDIKRFEKGLIEGCRLLDLPLVFVPRSRIEAFSFDGIGSKAAERHLGLKGVCEPCALISGRDARLILTKTVKNGVTTAIAREETLSSYTNTDIKDEA